MLALQKMCLATFHLDLGLHSMCMSRLHALHHAAYFITHVHVPTITCLLLRTLYTSHVHYTVGSPSLANNAMHSPSSSLHVHTVCTGPAPMVRLLGPWPYRFFVKADVRSTFG